MDKTIYIYIGYASLLTSLFPLFFACMNYKTLGPVLRVLLFLLIISFATDIASTTLMLFKINNLFLFHIYTFFEYILLGYIFHLLFNNKNLSLFVLFCTTLLFIISLFDSFYFHSLKEMNVITVFAESIVVISYTGIYFYLFLQRLEFSNPLSSSLFWLNSALLIYFAGSLFLFIFSNYVLSHPSNILWTINHINTILFRLILCIVFWKPATKTI